MVHRYVEAQYNLELGAAQITQLNKAISNGADKGTFYLPKGIPITVFVRCSLTFSVKVFPDASSSPQGLLRRLVTATPRRYATNWNIEGKSNASTRISPRRLPNPLPPRNHQSNPLLNLGPGPSLPRLQNPLQRRNLPPSGPPPPRKLRIRRRGPQRRKRSRNPKLRPNRRKQPRKPRRRQRQNQQPPRVPGLPRSLPLRAPPQRRLPHLLDETLPRRYIDGFAVYIRVSHFKNRKLPGKNQSPKLRRRSLLRVGLPQREQRRRRPLNLPPNRLLSQHLPPSERSVHLSGG